MCTTVTNQSTLSADCNSRYNLKSLTYTACQILLPLFFLTTVGQVLQYSSGQTTDWLLVQGQEHADRGLLL